MQILRLTTPKLKDVWGPVRSEWQPASVRNFWDVKLAGIAEDGTEIPMLRRSNRCSKAVGASALMGKGLGYDWGGSGTRRCSWPDRSVRYWTESRVAADRTGEESARLDQAGSRRWIGWPKRSWLRQTGQHATRSRQL